MTALWHVEMPDGRRRWATGPVEDGPSHFLEAGLGLATLLADDGPSLADLDARTSSEPVPADTRVIAPVDRQEVWAVGVTYLRSRDARIEESKHAPDHYDRVYDAQRPELFFKSTPERVRGPGEAICVREDSSWDVPEPELALAVAADGAVVGYLVGDDVSSRSIEGQNPLYIPQAKIFTGGCALGPCIVPAAQVGSLDELRIALEVHRDGASVYRDEVSVADLKHRPADLASWLTRGLDFPHGVMLMTGTAIVPPVEFTLTPGDEVEITITGLGRLHNPVELLATGPAPSDEEG